MSPAEFIQRAAIARALHRRLERERFAFSNGFRRSRRDNLWRIWEGKTVVVFHRESGRDAGKYGWVVTGDDDTPAFSTQSFATEEDAIEDVMKLFDLDSEAE